jgi:TRAP-type C4-dicarboxylate transport system substrate-binding protein
VACLCATGCDSDDASKAGGSVPPLTLRLGTPDPAGRASDPSIREFARQVEERSGGELRIEIDWGDQFGNIPEWDQRVARKVVDGELDMGLIPARAWDTEGVTTLRALQAPFLVTADSLLREITRGPLADEMLAGLDEAGVVGLALVPEALRHPVGFDRPLASPADFRGAALRVPVSETSYALFRSLGAVPRDLDGDEFTRAVQDRSVRGTEASYGGCGIPPRAAPLHRERDPLPKGQLPGHRPGRPR